MKSSLLTIVFLLFAQGVDACTTFLISGSYGHSDPTVAYNFDWNVRSGLVSINRRNVAKTALVLKPSDSPLQWTSKYGSLSYNQMGIEFPYTGMNEKGLVVSLVLLNETEYHSPTTELAAITAPQWVQFQLDTATNIDEAVSNAQKVRLIKGVGRVHFFVCDKQGACAVFEFLEGKLRVFRDWNFFVPVLSNQPYEESVASLSKYAPFGGGLIISKDPHPQTRFVEAAHWVSVYAKNQDSNLEAEKISYAFQLLNNVHQPKLTQWQIVYRPKTGQAFFRTRPDQKIRALNISDFEYSCAGPTMVSLLEEPIGQNSEFFPYNPKLGKKILDSCDYLGPNEFLGSDFRQKLLEYPVQSTRCNL